MEQSCSVSRIKVLRLLAIQVKYVSDLTVDCIVILSCICLTLRGTYL